MANWFEGKLASQLSIADIAALIEQAACEDERLELKRDPYAHNDTGRREMLKDICGLANADGGYLIVGVAESNQGAAVRVQLLPDAAAVADSMRQSCIDAIRPRVQDLEIAVVPGADGGVIVVRVPVSPAKPHMYTLGGRTQFVRRYGSQTREMTIEEIRSAFAGDALFVELARLGQRVDALHVQRRMEADGQATSDEDLLDITDRAVLEREMARRFELVAGDRPFYRIYLLPQTPGSVRIELTCDQVRQVMKEPPQTHPQGWTIWTMDDLLYTPPALLEGQSGREQRLVIVGNGFVEFTHPARSEPFQWRQSPTDAQEHPRLYPWALCELTVNFVRLAKQLYEVAGVASVAVIVKLELLGMKGFRLFPGLPDSVPHLAALREPYGRERAVARIDVAAFPCDPDPIAYGLLVQIYQSFGLEGRDVPFFDDKGRFIARES